MAVPPLIPEMPPAPVRSQGQATFNTVAEPFIAAMPPMVVNINIALTWIGQQASAIDGYRQAAATSAGSAADSASAADSSKKAAAQSAIDATNNGKAQVDLAKNQVSLAQQAAAAAQSAAQAAGAAAGLPGGRVPYTVLQINSAGNVSWGDGLLDRSSAVPGQALMLGSGKTAKWDFPGQQIGDILISARNPGVLYLPADGGIRLQSAYTELFAKLGLLGGSIGQSWPEVDPGAPSGIALTAYGASLIGTIIVTNNNGGSIRRSTDRGKTWSTVTVPSGQYNAGVDTDNQGTWILVGLSGAIVRSTDDGQTWQLVTVPASPGAGFSWAKVRYCGANTWLIGANGNSGGTPTSLIRSTNGGASFTYVDPGVVSGVSAIESNGKGTILIQMASLRKSTNFGSSWALGPAITGQAVSISSDKNGTWVLNTTSTTNGVYRSLDDAATFSVFPVTGYSTGPFWWVFIAYGLIFARVGTNAAGLKLQVYVGNGVWQNITDSANVGASSNGGSQIVDAGGGVLVGVSSGTTGRLVIAAPQFPYDTATQFALPLIVATAGTTAYTKAKELA